MPVSTRVEKPYAVANDRTTPPLRANPTAQPQVVSWPGSYQTLPTVGAQSQVVWLRWLGRPSSVRDGSWQPQPIKIRAHFGIWPTGAIHRRLVNLVATGKIHRLHLHRAVVVGAALGYQTLRRIRSWHLG